MAIMKIIRYPAGTLRVPCTRVALPLTGQLLNHLDDLRSTLAATPNGLALASNQIEPDGWQVFVVREGLGLPEVAINPRWRPAPPVTGRPDYAREGEGCLSIPGVQLDVTRYIAVQFWWTDEQGAEHGDLLSGLAARVVQHECEHLGGGLIVDHVDKKLQIKIRQQAIRDRKAGR